MKNIALLLLIGVAFIQLFILAMRIYKYEDTLQNGEVFYFKPYPVDPRDLLNGRYISLSFGKHKVKCDDKCNEIKNSECFYVGIDNKDGNITFSNIYLSKPKKGNFLRVVSDSYTTPKREYISFHFLFDRFYMNEYKAKKAEKAYNNLTKNDNFLAKVRVKNGDGVIENIYVNSIPLDRYIK